MDSDFKLFRLKRSKGTVKFSRNQPIKNHSLASRYLSSKNLSLSITLEKPINLPDISKTQAKLSYIESYKNLDRIIDRGVHKHLLPSPIVSYLHKVQENGLVPSTIGLLNKQVTDNTLDISHYSIGNSYAEALSEGISSIKYQKAVFKNNRLTDKGAANLIKNLSPDSISEIDLSQNSIGLSTIANICRKIDVDSSKLTVLSLDSNRLGDRPVILLCSVLGSGDRLVELSLADNNITEYGASAIAQYIQIAQTLEKLDLHWNNIRGVGAKDLALSLCENNSVKVLDLSWNAIASPLGDNSIPSFGKAIKQNSKLYHLDLSNNYLDQNDCKIIGDALVSNTTLIGLHMDGNGAILDNKGFLQLNVISSRTRNTHIYKPMLGKRTRNLENCWVCQHWNEVIFIINPVEKVVSVTLHLELYGYEGEIMEKINDRSFRLGRICPPGPLMFWFCYNNKPAVSSEYATWTYEVPVVVGEITCKFYNVFVNKKSSLKMWSQFHPHAHPRVQKSHSESEVWSHRHSIFKDYILDTSKLLIQCFDYDLTYLKLLEILTKDTEISFRVLRNGYLVIKDAYKYIAASSKNYWKQWQENIIDLLMSAGVIDNNHLKPSDLLGILKAVRSLEKEPPPELSRGQFLETFIRAALFKYVKNGVYNQSEALDIALKELATFFPIFSTNDYRNKKCYNSLTDKALKKHINWLISTFNSFENNSVIHFRDVVRIMNGYTKNEEFVWKSCYFAKETKRYEKYIECVLRFPEFIEAFVRIIDGERNDQDLKRLSIDVLVDIVINDYFKNSRSLIKK